MNQSYGEWLRQKREEKGWTQIELHSRSGVTNQQIELLPVLWTVS